MHTWFRNGHPIYPFLWESPPQPPARWHAAADAPTSYFSDTPDGAWAEFLRHEGITDADDLRGVSRRLWAVEVPDEVIDQAARPKLDDNILLGNRATYPACQAEARRLRKTGARALVAPSAA